MVMYVRLAGLVRSAMGVGVLVVLIAAVGLPGATSQGAVLAQADERCFAETGFCISGRIREFWEQQGGLPVFGYPITPQREEYVQGQPFQVQWFERNRLELHPENAPPYDVLLGHLGAQVRALHNPDWRNNTPLSTDPVEGCRFFQETEQHVCGDMLAMWQAHGLEFDGQPGTSEAESLALFGLPISPLQEETIDGQPFQVQWFERARFELHPENDPPYHVLLGLLSRDMQPDSLLATLPLGGEARGIALDTAGDYAYLSVDARLVSVAVGAADESSTMPAVPRVIGESAVVSGTDRVVEVAVQGDYAYATALDAGLLIFDVRDPAAPRLVSSYTTDFRASESFNRVQSVAVVGNTAYVGTDSGLATVDIRDPTNPVERDFLPILRGVNDVVVDGSRAFVVGFSSLSILNIGGDSQVREGAFAPGLAYRVAAADGYAYLFAISTLYSLDVRTPGAELDRYCCLPGVVASMQVAEDVLSVAHTYSNAPYEDVGALLLFDITDPANLSAPLPYPTRGNPQDVVVRGERAYVADGSSGLTILQLPAADAE
jgi:hypothetical protein